jgi:hypothetical protein
MMESTSAEVSDSNSETRFSRNPDILERRVDDTIFLVNPEDDTIFYLNPLSAGIWRLMAESISTSEVIHTIQQAFPDTPTEEIASDVSKLVEELIEKGLVRRRA